MPHNRLDMGKEKVMEFAQDTPGDYPFVCSFLGHGIISCGVRHVK